MSSIADMNLGTIGFRFSTPDHLALCNLFAIGKEIVRDPSYHWDGLKRSDGPLLLFQYTLDGEGVFESNGHTYRVSPGKAMLANIPSEHRYYFPENSSHWTFLFLLIRPDLILPNWEEAKRKLGEVFYAPPSSRLIRLLDGVWEEANNGRITDSYTSSAHVFQFVSELCRYAAAPQHERSEWPEKVRLATAYIDSHYDRMISLELLSEQLGVSKYHLLRIFKAATGLSPNDYCNRVRIENAMKLLNDTNWSVERIAEQVGFSSGSYFIKVFRKMTGTTPGNVRSGSGHITYSRFIFD